IWTIFFIAAYQSQTNLQFFVVDCWPAMAGIAFMSINARIFLSSLTASKSGFTTASVTNSRYAAPYTSNSENTTGNDSYAVNSIAPVAVSISHIVENDREKGTHFGSEHD
ncbi:hypothetical protein PQX77_008677, partial [Marasmius sp. AFHP31]